MTHAPQLVVINGEGKSTEKPEHLSISRHTLLSSYMKKSFQGSVLPELYGSGTRWTATVDPPEVFTMEEIPRFIYELGASVSELKTDVKYINEKLTPIPDMATNLVELKTDVKHMDKKFGILVWFTGGILIAVIAGVITGVIILILQRL